MLLCGKKKGPSMSNDLPLVTFNGTLADLPPMSGLFEAVDEGETVFSVVRELPNGKYILEGLDGTYATELFDSAEDEVEEVTVSSAADIRAALYAKQYTEPAPVSAPAPVTTVLPPTAKLPHLGMHEELVPYLNKLGLVGIACSNSDTDLDCPDVVLTALGTIMYKAHSVSQELRTRNENLLLDYGLLYDTNDEDFGEDDEDAPEPKMELDSDISCWTDMILQEEWLVPGAYVDTASKAVYIGRTTYTSSEFRRFAVAAQLLQGLPGEVNLYIDDEALGMSAEAVQRIYTVSEILLKG